MAHTTWETFCDGARPVSQSYHNHPLDHLLWSQLILLPLRVPSFNSKWTYQPVMPHLKKTFARREPHNCLHTLRPCIDYRALNKLSINFCYPFPLVPEALEQLCGASIFNKLDIRSTNILIRFVRRTSGRQHLWHLQDAMITALCCTAWPTIFNIQYYSIIKDFMNEVLWSSWTSCGGIYRQHNNDILPESGRTSPEYQLFLKAEKCSFHQSSIQFLGYQISKESIQMDEGKVFKSSPGQLPKQSKSSKDSSVLLISITASFITSVSSLPLWLHC